MLKIFYPGGNDDFDVDAERLKRDKDNIDKVLIQLGLFSGGGEGDGFEYEVSEKILYIIIIII